MSRIIYNIRDMKGGGIVDNGYTKRIRERVLSLEDGTVFVMSDFADIADTSTIRQSLSRLVQSGTLRRILKGVYEKPKYSKLLDEYVAADPEAVANALARSYHWTIAPCGNTALNLLGLSTQVTAVWSYISDGPYKTYEWNSTKLEFKHRTNKEIRMITAIAVSLQNKAMYPKIKDTPIISVPVPTTFPYLGISSSFTFRLLYECIVLILPLMFVMPSTEINNPKINNIKLSMLSS